MVKIFIEHDLHNFRDLFGFGSPATEEFLGLHTDESYTPNYISILVTRDFIEERLPIKLHEDIVVVISRISPIFMTVFDIVMMKCSFDGHVQYNKQIILEVRYKTIDDKLKLSCSIDGDERLYDLFKIPYENFINYNLRHKCEEESNEELNIFKIELANAINKYFSMKSRVKSARSFPISSIEN